MLLVVDANIVLSSLISGTSTDLILSPRLKLVAPELFFMEIQRNLPDIKKRSHLSPVEFELVFQIIERHIDIVPMDEFLSYLPKAEQLLGDHKKDAPYVALALYLNCPFWSYEKRFKKFKTVESLTTKDVRERLQYSSFSFGI